MVNQYNFEAGEYVGVRTDSRKFYLKDHLGSIRQTINESGTVMSAMDYYAFGGTKSSYVNGSTVDKYRFTGKERDLETGLDYFGARYYDSKICRWMSVDPLADKYPGLSPYNYSMDDPINNFDPDGSFTIRNNLYRCWTLSGADTQQKWESMPGIGIYYQGLRNAIADPSFIPSPKENFGAALTTGTGNLISKIGKAFSTAFESLTQLGGNGITDQQMEDIVSDQNAFESILNTSEGGVNIAVSVPSDESSGGLFMKMNPAIVNVWKKQKGWKDGEAEGNAQLLFMNKVYAKKREEKIKYRNRKAQLYETSSYSVENQGSNR